MKRLPASKSGRCGIRSDGWLSIMKRTLAPQGSFSVIGILRLARGLCFSGFQVISGVANYHKCNSAIKGDMVRIKSDADTGGEAQEKAAIGTGYPGVLYFKSESWCPSVRNRLLNKIAMRRCSSTQPLPQILRRRREQDRLYPLQIRLTTTTECRRSY